CMALPLVGEPNVPGGEFRVNQTTTLIRQMHPTAAFDGAGNSLLVWEHEVAGIKGRFFGADGVAAGSELTLVANSAVSVPFQGTVATRKDPVAAFLPNGSFFLFWTEQFSYQSVALFIQSVQIQESDVYGQRFDHSVKSVGARIRVTTATAVAQSLPKVQARANDLVVIWQSDHRDSGVIDQAIYGQRVDFSGHLVGSEFRATGASIQALSPALAAAPSGKFIVAWEANDAQGKGVFAQLFDASATAVGSDFQVNTDTALDQRRPAVAADHSGNFMVV